MSEFDHESPRHLGRKALWFTLVPVLVAFALFGVTAWKQHYFSQPTGFTPSPTAAPALR